MQKVSTVYKVKNWIGRIINRKVEFFVLGYQFVFDARVRKAQRQESSGQHARKFLNVGAGNFYRKNWINIDKASDFYQDGQKPNNTVYWDLLSLTSLPFADNSIDLIYASHVIEHVSDEAVSNFFSESFLKLKKGGGIRVVCPDMEYLFRAYKRGDRTPFFPIHDYGKKHRVTRSGYYSLPIIENVSIQQLFLWAFARQASIYHNKAVKPLTDEEVDTLFSHNSFEKALDACVRLCDISVQDERPEEHINWWTEEKVVNFLKGAGFDTVFRSRWGQSIFPEMRDTRYFDTNSPHLSLYVEATKS